MNTGILGTHIGPPKICEIPIHLVIRETEKPGQVNLRCHILQQCSLVRVQEHEACMFALLVRSPGIARHRGFASLTHSKSQSRIVVTSAAAHGRIVKTVKKVTTYMEGTVKRQNTSSSERSWRKIAKTRQSLFRKSAWSGYAHKMCAVDSNTKRLYSNEMSDRATHFTVFMIMNCPVEQQILAALIADELSQQFLFT